MNIHVELNVLSKRKTEWFYVVLKLQLSFIFKSPSNLDQNRK